MKYLIISLSCFISACSSGDQKHPANSRDSVENSEMKKVEQMKLNEDSLIREEEKRLFKK